MCFKNYIFDVLGGYVNEYKCVKLEKDYYVRVLYPFPQNSFKDYYDKNIVEVYRTCGATMSMMNDKTLYKEKSLKPDDSFVEKESTYRVIPFDKSLDTLQIRKLIVEGK